MAKFSAEELSSRVNDLELEDDVKISLMEDLTDSISTDESDELKSLKDELEKIKDEYEVLKDEYDALKEKYKSRFLKAIEVDESEKEETEDDEDLEEKEVIDIKEI